jgi:hypothetical protein
MAGLLVAASLVPCSCDAPVAAEPPAPLQLALAVHVHSTFSNGDLSIDGLLERAAAAGLDGVVLTDNYALDIDYGLWPLRGLLRHRVALPSVSRDELPAWLDAVRRAGARHPRMVLIAGLEIIPHYHWSGALWRDDLTLHDTQKNLLVVGFEQPAQWAMVIGRRPARSVGRWLADGWPLLLAAPALWLWRHERGGRRRRYRWPAATLGLIGALLLANTLVLGGRPFDAYQPDPGARAAQTLIDRARGAGGLTFWSLPETSDLHRYRAGEISRWLAWLPRTITVKTDPHPGVLEATTGFTGFGGLYEDDARAAEPGGLWDRLLLDYLDGRRPAPHWAVGELAFHQEGREGKRLGDLQTVVLATERSAPAVLTSLGTGAFYARRRTPGWALRLDDFSIEMSGNDLVLRLAVSATDGRAERVRLRIIRSGRLWQELYDTTPIDRRWREPLPSGRGYYRVEVGQGDQHLLSTPLFIDHRGARS